MGSAIGEEIFGALQATISVLLVLAYGGLSVKWLKIVSAGCIDEVTKLGTNVFLPALLFSQMGKEATPSKLLEYWILPVACTFFTLLSLLYAFVGVRLLNMPEWLYPAAAFPNMLSLPLLMAQSLAKTGSLDKLLNGPDDTVEDALDRAKVYFLVSALAGNMIRFAIGPRLLRAEDTQSKRGAVNGNPALHRNPERQPLIGHNLPGSTLTTRHEDDRNSRRAKVWSVLRKLGKVRGAFNPPLVAGLLAIFFGLIPATHKALFTEKGIFTSNFTQSIKTLGDLYTGLQIFVLGGKLVTKNTSRATFWPLLYLFIWRFALLPAVSIGLIYLLRSSYPNYIKQDAILDFVLAISQVGPPAITLIAMADLAGLDDDEQGIIATVLLASYVVTPLLSLPVSGAITAISRLYARH